MTGAGDGPVGGAAADDRHRPNVVLTGFMGTGKTTVGRLLARRLGYRFVDTDELIESRGPTIAEIFASQGETAFREIEHSVAVELAGREATVVATGGRMLLDPRNEACLGATGRVFCLVAPVEAILARVRYDAAGRERPLLAVDDPRARITELLRERAPRYGRFEQVDTHGRAPVAVVDDLVARLSGPGSG